MNFLHHDLLTHTKPKDIGLSEAMSQNESLLPEVFGVSYFITATGKSLTSSSPTEEAKPTFLTPLKHYLIPSECLSQH